MQNGRFRRHLLLGSLALGLTVGLAGGVALASEQTMLAQASAAQRYDLPAGALAASLNRLAVISGLQVVYDAGLTQSLQAPAVSGTLTREVALERLLAGSGLTFRFTGPNTVQIERLPQGSSAAVLPPVRVQGAVPQTETAWGPAEGITAKRSATATKTDASILETPQSISVVTRENMDTRNVQSVNEALRYSAGVKVEPYGPDTRHDWIFVRGFDASVQGLYMNGLRWQAGQIAGRIDPYGLERVEVLKGPASVLYGLAQPGGMVNLVTKRPGMGNFGEVRVEGGNFDRFQGSFDVNTEASPQWQFRVTGLVRDSETQVDFIDDNRMFIAPALTWRPNDATSLTVLANYQQDNTSAAQFLPAIGTVSGTPFGKIPRGRFLGDPNWDQFDREQYSLGYMLEHELNDTWTLRQNLRYNGIDTSWKQLYTNALQADNRTLTRFAFQGDIHTDVFAVDNQAQAKFETGPLMQHTLLFGLDTSLAKRDNFQRRAAGPNLDLYNPVYGVAIPTNLPVIANLDEKIYQTGLYAQDQVKIADHWVVTLNGRQDFVRENGSAGPTATAARVNTKREDDAFTWRGGVTYLFDNGLAPYASYATSFLPTAGRDFSGRPFNPTESEQYEAGLKFQPPGSNSSVTTSVFDLTQTNVLTADPANGATFQVQTGEIQVRGYELEGTVNLMPGLNVIGAYTYLDAEITSTNTVAERGKRPSGIPKHASSLWGDYTIQTGDFKGLGFGAGVRYTGETPGTNAGAFMVSSYTLYDAMLRYDLNDAWRFGLNVSNLFDQEYVSQCATANGCYFGNGRTVIASMRYRW